LASVPEPFIGYSRSKNLPDRGYPKPLESCGRKSQPEVFQKEMILGHGIVGGGGKLLYLNAATNPAFGTISRPEL
jgi:hypothetical protein